MADEKKEEIELEPAAPKKYPEELEELAKKLEEAKSKKQAEPAPEFKVTEKPASEKPEKAIKPEAEKPSKNVEGGPIMPAKAGDVLISQSGTQRKVLEARVDPNLPGGGFLEVETTKKGETYKDVISFKDVQEAKEGEIIKVIDSGKVKELAERKEREIQANKLRKQKNEAKTEPAKEAGKPISEEERAKMAEKIATSLLAGIKKEKAAPKIKKVPQRLKEEAAPAIKQEEKAPEPATVVGEPVIEKPAEPEKLTDEQKLEQLLENAPGNLGEIGEEKKSEGTKSEKPTEAEKLSGQPAEVKVEAKEEPIETAKPLPEPESGEPEDPAFKTEEALNDQEFLEFLTKYPDAEKIDSGAHQREIEKRHKIFNACKVLGGVVGEFYNKEAGQELGLPIDKEMTQKMLDAVEREAIADPESLIKRTQEIVEYENLKNDTTALDKQLEEFGGVGNREEALKFIEEKLHKLGEEKHQKKISVGFVGLINPENNPIAGWWFRKMMTEEERAWRKQIREAPQGKRKEIFAEIDKKIEAFAKAKAELEKINEKGMRHRFDDLRQDLFQKFEPIKMLFEDMQQRAVNKISNLLEKKILGVPGIKKIEEARQYLEKLRVLHKKFSLDVQGSDFFAQELDRRLEEIVDELVRENIKGFKITSKPLEKMLSEFSKLINKVTGIETKQALLGAIVFAIDKAVDHLQESGRGKPAAEGKEPMMKKILLQAIKAKLLAEAIK